MYLIFSTRGKLEESLSVQLIWTLLEEVEQHLRTVNQILFTIIVVLVKRFTYLLLSYEFINVDNP